MLASSHTTMEEYLEEEDDNDVNNVSEVAAFVSVSPASGRGVAGS